MNIVSLKTQDGLNLNAAYYPGTGGRGVILLHQFRRDHSSMDFFADALNKKGYHVLSVDLRGHGKSEGDLSKFNDMDFKNMFYDALAAEEFLHQLDHGLKIQMVGASIGANTALRFQEMNTVDSVVLLSPGRNYHGIDPTDANLSNIACPVYFIASKEDSCAVDTQALYAESSVSPELKKISLYPGSAHGIDILSQNNEALSEVLAWIDMH